MNADKFMKEFIDLLAPRLDTYEQAIYLYAVRHSRLVDQAEVVIGFKSARKTFAFGIGKKGTPLSEGVCYEKIRSLEAKGCIKILGSERSGTRLQVFLPEEIEGVIEPRTDAVSLSLEEMDFFNVPENRNLIVKRENHKCFYCLRQLNDENYVIEHVQSRPEGNCSYRNIVAACRNCNNRKGASPAKDHLRTLYREGFLGECEFENRMSHLELLLAGELKPEIDIG